MQFVWPHVRKSIKGNKDDVIDQPRKSISMGALKPTQSNAIPTVHKKRTTNEGATKSRFFISHIIFLLVTFYRFFFKFHDAFLILINFSKKKS